MIERTEMQFLESIVVLLGAKTIVEIGVAHGDGTIHLCRGTGKVGGHVFGFDIWNRHGLKRQFSKFGSLKAVSRRLIESGFNNFTLTQIDTINDKDKFVKVLDGYCPDGIDFAFIDGCHSYLGVKNDLSAIYPRLKPTGVVAFHDTLMIDGCREFMLDLRTKYFDGTFDVIDLPFGCHSKRRTGISLLVKRSYPVVDVAITEVCGSISTEDKIERQEQIWLEMEKSIHKKDMKNLLNHIDEMQFRNLGDHKQRRKETS